MTQAVTKRDGVQTSASLENASFIQLLLNKVERTGSWTHGNMLESLSVHEMLGTVSMILSPPFLPESMEASDTLKGPVIRRRDTSLL